MIESEVLEEWEMSGADVCVLDAAVLIEAGWDAIVDTIWIVEADYAIARARLIAKGFTIADSEAFSRAQMEPTERRKAAIGTGKPVTVIINNSDIDVLHHRVYNLWQTLTHN